MAYEATTARARTAADRKTMPQAPTLTIGQLARAADVGVETVRYYQRRELLAVPPRAGVTHGIRRYGPADVARIGFIRRAQALGFTLDEIASLLRLEDGTDRRSIRRIASARLEQIRARRSDLDRMERTLTHLIHECETAERAPRCPIVASLAGA